jgi:hypothetical protein
MSENVQASPQPDSTQCTINSSEPTSPIKETENVPIPSDKVNLRLLLVSGETKDVLVSPSDTIAHVLQDIYSNWPKSIFFYFILFNIICLYSK